MVKKLEKVDIEGRREEEKRVGKEREHWNKKMIKVNDKE